MNQRKKVNKIKLSGKTVLITGGAGGLGEQLTRRFASRGCRVILYDISEERLKNIVDKYVDVHYQVVDLTKLDDVKLAIENTIKQFGDIDILINNAGLVIGKSILDADYQKIQDVMTVNTTSPMWLIKGFLPGMLKKKNGHIVNVASVMGSFGASNMIPYCASKGGAVMMGEALRYELHDTGVTTTTVMPYHIDTPMFKGLETPWYTRFVTPTLKVEYVADQIVNAIENRKEMIIMPRIFWFIYLMRFVFPVAVFDRFAKFAGVCSSMNRFIGRN